MRSRRRRAEAPCPRRRAVRDAGCNGFVALEYEGPEDDREGVPASVRFMNEVMAGL
ncbi:MAG TPA: hypothetical protein P5137_01895 [Candidatus Brocadiia bacterium]|nr:hypothetical protein [Candidatus Brocadiia bacterium]